MRGGGETGAAPEWSFADSSKYPPLETLFEQAGNVYRKFRNVQFVSVHVGGYSENLKEVGRWLDEIQIFQLTLQRVFGELGKHPADEGHEFFTKHQNRILFGTDLAFWNGCDVQGPVHVRILLLKKTGSFYDIHWRYFQTNDKQFDHPTPIQGKWKIDGIGLDQEALKKIYWITPSGSINLTVSWGKRIK